MDCRPQVRRAPALTIRVATWLRDEGADPDGPAPSSLTHLERRSRCGSCGRACRWVWRCRAHLRLPRGGGQCRADGVLAGRMALLVRERPIRGRVHRVPGSCRQLSASGPASTSGDGRNRKLQDCLHRPEMRSPEPPTGTHPRLRHGDRSGAVPLHIGYHVHHLPRRWQGLPDLPLGASHPCPPDVPDYRPWRDTPGTHLPVGVPPTR